MINFIKGFAKDFGWELTIMFIVAYISMILLSIMCDISIFYN